MSESVLVLQTSRSPSNKVSVVPPRVVTCVEDTEDLDLHSLYLGHR